MPQLPISSSLREAKADSIGDLLNRPVEGMADTEIAILVQYYRDLRAKFSAAEAAVKPRSRNINIKQISGQPFAPSSFEDTEL